MLIFNSNFSILYYLFYKKFYIIKNCSSRKNHVKPDSFIYKYKNLLKDRLNYSYFYQTFEK